MAQSASHSKYWLSVLISFAAAAVLVTGCDKGLAPVHEPSGFKGVIYYSNWPPASQVLELRLLAFRDVPRDSSKLLDLLLAAASTNPGSVVLYPPVGVTGFSKFVDTTHYQLITPGSTLLLQQYSYIVVAQRYGPNFFSDWKPAGVYTLNPQTFEPEPVRVLLHVVRENVDIHVDFNNPPPKPWR